MATFTVTDDILNSPAAEDYFNRADRRVKVGLRATLEILQLPMPEYAKRGMPGRTPAKDVTHAYGIDNPKPRTLVLHDRKPNASSEAVAAAKARHAAKLNGAHVPMPSDAAQAVSLFQETFG